MRILLASASFSRAYGGPAYSVSRLGLALAEGGATVGLWAPDGSATRARALWGERNASLKLVELDGSVGSVLNSFGIPDVLHDSGLWLPHNHALARQAHSRGIPRIVSTRGMLDPWALGHKRVKKALAWRLYQRRDLVRADALHVTSEAEARNLATMNLCAPICLIRNGIDLPPADLMAFRGGCAQPRRAVFLGRLHPVKGLPLLLASWAAVRPDGWELLLAGPDESGYRAILEAEIRRLDLQGAVRFTGVVAGREKSELFRCADLFVLPSESESFATVIAEALAHGLPVLTTVNVPWPQIEDHRCGWRVAAKAGALSDCLVRVTSLSREELASAGQRGRDLVAREFGWDAIARDFVACYENL